MERRARGSSQPLEEVTPIVIDGGQVGDLVTKHVLPLLVQLVGEPRIAAASGTSGRLYAFAPRAHRLEVDALEPRREARVDGLLGRGRVAMDRYLGR